MDTLLRIDSSGKGSQSVTQQLTKAFVERWQEANPQGKLVSRDLMVSELPYVNENIVGAYYTAVDQLTQSQKQLLQPSEEMIAELFAANTWVFGVPMYNFAAPAVFKAYIDLIIRAGKTFSYEGGSPKGLLENKKLYVITASGADYSLPAMQSMDFLEPYVRTIFGFVGVQDITFIKVFGHQPAIVEEQIGKAKAKIEELLQVAVAV
jgi:FMN-dependent NADH-azoreductase